MNKLYKGLLAFILTVTISVSLSAQQSFFGFAGANMKRTTAGKQEIFPQRYAGYTLDIVGLRSFLWSLPAEKTLNKSRSNAPVMQLPMPDGKLARFKEDL